MKIACRVLNNFNLPLMYETALTEESIVCLIWNEIVENLFIDDKKLK